MVFLAARRARAWPRLIWCGSSTGDRPDDPDGLAGDGAPGLDSSSGRRRRGPAATQVLGGAGAEGQVVGRPLGIEPSRSASGAHRPLQCVGSAGSSMFNLPLASRAGGFATRSSVCPVDQSVVSKARRAAPMAFHVGGVAVGGHAENFLSGGWLIVGYPPLPPGTSFPVDEQILCCRRPLSPSTTPALCWTPVEKPSFAP